MRKKILLVDDEEILVLTLARSLRKAGFEVATQDTGAGAIDSLRQHAFDVVITDLAMEDVHGTEVLKEAKTRDPDSCVIVITGYADEESGINALRLGAEDYLTKPFQPEELILRASRCLEQGTLRRKVRLYERLLPVCPQCNRIRQGDGSNSEEWVHLDEYAERQCAEAFTQTRCPGCEEA